MQNQRIPDSGRIPWRILTIVGAALVATVSTADAKPRVQRVGHEVAVGGITQNDRVAQQFILRSELLEVTPKDAGKNPISVALTATDRADLAAPTTGGQPMLIGLVKQIVPSFEVTGGDFEQGVSQQAADGSTVWAVTAISPEAVAIRVHFSDFSLPLGAEMFFLNTDGAADGPYTGRGRNGNGDFWTRSISSNTGVILLRYGKGTTPASVRSISFTVSQLAHIHFRNNPGGGGGGIASHDTWPCSNNATCLVDANCVGGTPADAAKDAVAKMEWISGPSVFTCSGGLLADTDPTTQIPHFLTANHCTSTSIANMETWFNYMTDSCNGVCPHNILTGGAPPSDTIGFTVLATSANSDFTLGTLNQAPPAGAVFLGWNNSPVAFTNATQLWRISNANFGPQVYSQQQVDTGSPVCGGLPRGDFIYSDSNTGGTMGGSSGSPVINAASEVVGQLFGCCGFNCANVCASAPTNWTVDGAFAVTFPSVEQFLAPPILVLTGSCFFDAGMTQPVDPLTVEVTNLDTGVTFQASTAANQYTLVLDTDTDVSAGDTLRYIAKDDTDFINVTDRVVAQADIDAGSLALDLVLDEYFLDLNDFPHYEAESPVSDKTGAAVAQMVLNYIWWDSDIDPTPPLTFPDQTALYDYGIANNATAGLTVLDTLGIFRTIQDNRPLPYSQFGYNFAIKQNTDATDALKQIAQWISYTIGTFGGHEPGTPLHVPGVIPAYGDYSNWMAVRGIHTTESAYPLPADLEVFGFWLNDPIPSALGGIGENSYKTANEFLATYYFALTTGDAYDGKFVAICEPPDDVSDKNLTLAKDEKQFTKADTVLIDKVRNGLGTDEEEAEANSKIIEAATNGVRDQLIPYDDAFAKRFQGTVGGTPLAVTNDYGDDYFAVPFDDRAGTAVVVLIDVADGHFKETSWVSESVAYPTLSEDKARQLAYDAARGLGIDPRGVKSALADLVRRDAIPFHPQWRFLGDGFEILVSQGGTVTGSTH